MSDIVDKLAGIRHSFLSAGLKPPSAIYLESPEEGARFLSQIRQTSYSTYTIPDKRLGQPVEHHDGSVYMMMEIMGMKVLWPSNALATPDGIFYT